MTGYGYPKGLNPGITASDYHRDNVGAQVPTLSASIANILLRQSPLHAWHAHPKLGRGKREESETFDIGSGCHALLLEGEDRFHVVDADSWRTNAAKDERDAARAIGCYPILAHKMDEIREMAKVVRHRLDGFGEVPTPLRTGAAEQTIVWQEQIPEEKRHRGGVVWCRARIDWLHEDGLVLDDLKTTERSARPESWIRSSLYGMGMHLQAAFYLRGWKKVAGKDARFRFVVVETSPPFALSVVGMSPAAIAHADDMVEQAILSWAECLQTNQWPSYPSRTCYADPPAYEVAAWEAARMDEENEG